MQPSQHILVGVSVTFHALGLAVRQAIIRHRKQATREFTKHNYHLELQDATHYNAYNLAHSKTLVVQHRTGTHP